MCQHSLETDFRLELLQGKQRGNSFHTLNACLISIRVIIRLSIINRYLIGSGIFYVKTGALTGEIDKELCFLQIPGTAMEMVTWIHDS